MSAQAAPRRNTRQREAVRAALSEAEGFVSAQSLHAALRASGTTVGLATVYRALTDLAEDGDADTLQHEGETLYRACTPGRHHHHLICRQCGLAIEVRADAVERWAAELAAAHGFTEPDHVADVFGLCPACAR